MKTKFRKSLLLLGFLGLGLGSCSDDDNDNVVMTDQTLLKVFEQMYPGVPVMEWEVEFGIYRAEFLKDGKPAEAWFQPDGTWVKTKTDLLPADLPEAVVNFLAENYAGYPIDDVDWVETPSGNYYFVELDAKGADIYLQLLPDGSLLT